MPLLEGDTGEFTGNEGDIKVARVLVGILTLKPYFLIIKENTQ